MKKKTTYYLLLLFVCSTLSGQIKTTIDFSSRNFEKFFKSTIELRSSGQTVKIYNDTLKKFNVTNENIIKEKGDYTLFVKYQNQKSCDSLNYNFQVTGLEQNIYIIVQFSHEKDSKKINHNTGDISVEKINNGSENIKLETANLKRVGDQVLLKLINNSNDTIFGEYLPGYFWGGLSYKLPNNEWSSYYGGQIDFNFAYEKPLMPDSTTFTYCGSFGEHKYRKTGLCKYKLLYSTSWTNGHSYKKYLETKETTWWTNICEYYKLEKEIEVKY